MSLLEQIKIDKDAARKAYNARDAGVLTTLFAESQKVGKDDGDRESTDDEVVAVAKKFIKGIEETLGFLYLKKESANQRHADAIELLEHERGLIEAYLPQMVEDDVLRAFVQAQIADGANHQGKLMGAVKKEFGQTVDMKSAGVIISEEL